MKNTILFIFLLLGLVTLAQEKDKFLPDANSDFADKNYRDAEAKFRMSQSKFPENSKSLYNLGNTIYTINQPAEAGQAFIKAAEKAKTRSEKHKAFHNLGNVFMKDKNYTAAVKAYREALINNPADDETRYNYALAKKFLKDNPPPPKKDKDDKDKQDKKEQDEKSDDKKEKDDKEGDEKDKKNLDGDKDDKSKQPKPEPREGQGIPKQRIENLLDAVNNEEKKVQDKIKAQQIKGKPVQTDKDW